MAQRSRKASVVLLPSTGRGGHASGKPAEPPAPPGPRLMVPAEAARLDGKRVIIEGAEEIVLQCGKASLTLRRDGKIVLRGVNVVSHADQVQRIRGGTVKIN